MNENLEHLWNSEMDQLSKQVNSFKQQVKWKDSVETFKYNPSSKFNNQDIKREQFEVASFHHNY